METPFATQVRARERAHLQEWLQQVAQGNGGILILMGDWGMGRTSLLRDALAHAPTIGLITADTWCRGEHGEPGWMPLASLMEQLLRHFGEEPLAQPLQEGLQQWLAFPQSWHIPAQFIRPLRALARKRGLLLCIDDLHLASEQLCRLIQSWLSGIRFEPIGLLLTICTPIEHPLLHELIRRGEQHGVARTLTLEPLNREQVRALIECWRPALAGDETLAEALQVQTAGNLLLITEILRNAETWEAEWHARRELTTIVPTSLRTPILQRMQTLQARERELLQWLSCFESAIPEAILPALMNCNERRIAQWVASLLRTGWLEPARQQPHALAWRHPLVRKVIYETIPTHRRAAMHRQIAERLEQNPLLPDEQRWWHWTHAEPDSIVLERLWNAYLQARQHANPRFRLELLEACLQAATLQGDHPKRVQLLCERPHLMYCLPNGLMRALEASQQAIVELEAHPDCDPDRTLWVQVHCARAGQLAQLGRSDEARQAINALLESGGWSDAQQSMLELTLAYLHACQGDLRTACALHRTVWTRMRANRDWWQRWMGVLRYTLRYALACADLELAHDVLTRFSHWCNHPSAPSAWQSSLHLMQADLAYFEGRGAEQLYHASASRSAESTAEPYSIDYESEFQIRLYRDPLEALHIAERALTAVREAMGYEREAEWLCYRAQALMEAERFIESLATLAEARRLARKLNHQLVLARSALLQATVVLLMNRPAQACDALIQAEPSIRALNLPELNTEFERLQSMLMVQQGDLTAAQAHAQKAVEHATAWGHALYRGLALLQHAAVLQAQGSPQAVSVQEEAESLLSGYGMPLVWRRLQAPRPTIEWVQQRGWELEVRLLGTVRLRFRGRELPPDEWVSPRTRALFAHLTLLQGRPVYADTLCELHFAHLPLERARVNLQTTVSAVRRTLRRAFGETAGDWLRYDSGFYRWAPDHSWTADAFEFERIARDALSRTEPEAQQARLDEALALYQGDLLPEFAEEEWCAPHYHRLHALYLECLLVRAQIASLAGRLVEVIEYGGRLLEIDPCDEAAARLLMQAYRALGRRAEALQVYTRCQKALAELLGASPSEPTRQLYESLVSAVS